MGLITIILFTSFIALSVSKIQERNKWRVFENLFKDINLLADMAKDIDPSIAKPFSTILNERVGMEDWIIYVSINKDIVTSEANAFVTLFIQELFYSEGWDVYTALKDISIEEWENALLTNWIPNYIASGLWERKLSFSYIPVKEFQKFVVNYSANSTIVTEKMINEYPIKTVVQYKDEWNDIGYFVETSHTYFLIGWTTSA